MTPSQVKPQISGTNLALHPATTAELEEMFSSFNTEISQLRQQLALQTTRMSELEQRLKLTEQSASPLEIKHGATSPGPGTATSRRKMLKRLGWAAAGLAAASAASVVSEANQTVQAASGDVALLGNSNMATDPTYFSQTSGATPAAIIWGDWNSTAQSSAPPANVQPGIAGTSNGGVGGYFAAANNVGPLLLQPSTLSGPPASGRHFRGELYIDVNGSIFISTADTDGTTPPSWVKLMHGTSPISNALRIASAASITSSPSYFAVEGVNAGVVPDRVYGIYGLVTISGQTADGTVTPYKGDLGAVPTTGAISVKANTITTCHVLLKLGPLPSGPNAGKKGIAIASSTACTVTVDVTGYLG